ncbi:MAG TPA: hypothetical protein VGH27_35800 [Streptosporangiaceae bacterium]
MRAPRAWEQAILRFVNTVVGFVAGIATAWFGLRVVRPRIQGPAPVDQPQHR